jgi:hypothetical protein
MIIALLILVATALLVIPELAPGTPRIAGWATLAIVTVLALWRLRPRSRQRLRR